MPFPLLFHRFLTFGRRSEILEPVEQQREDRKSTRLNSSHSQISYAVFCLKKKKNRNQYARGNKKSNILAGAAKTNGTLPPSDHTLRRVIRSGATDKLLMIPKEPYFRTESS